MRFGERVRCQTQPSASETSTNRMSSYSRIHPFARYSSARRCAIFLALPLAPRPSNQVCPRLLANSFEYSKAQSGSWRSKGCPTTMAAYFQGSPGSAWRWASTTIWLSADIGLSFPLSRVFGFGGLRCCLRRSDKSFCTAVQYEGGFCLQIKSGGFSPFVRRHPKSWEEPKSLRLLNHKI